MPFNFAVCRIEYIAAARSPPEWLPAKSQLRLPNTTVAFYDEVGDAWRAVSNGISWQ
jgi:hypothetical protein